MGSASPGVTGTQVTPVDCNHIDICKPPNRRSLVYKDTRELLERLPNAKPHSARSAAGTPQAPFRHLEVYRTRGFRGRGGELADIEAALWKSEQGRAALTGSGGVGKSTLAREYAWRNRERYAGVGWLRAEKIETTIEDLLKLGSGLTEPLPANRNMALQWVLAQLSSAGSRPWLLIYDNVEKPQDIAKLMPSEGAHVLVTTRFRHSFSDGHGFAEIPIGVFPRALAIEFLTGRAGLTIRNRPAGWRMLMVAYLWRWSMPPHIAGARECRSISTIATCLT